MKIAICHYSCPPVIGGIEAVVEQQARLLKTCHHSTKVIAGSGGKFSRYIDVDINPMLGTGLTDDERLTSRREADRLMEPDILSILGFLEYSLSSFDVLIAHNVLSMHHNLALTHAIHRMAERGRIKVIGWNYDSPFFSLEPGGGCPPSWEILRKVSPHIRYVSTSEAGKEQFEKLYGGTTEVSVIPNGISVSAFLRLQDITKQLVTDKRLHESDLILLLPGRFHPGKNIEFGIGVMKALLNRGINAAILLTAAIDPHDPESVDYYNRIKRLIAEAGIKEHFLFISEFVYHKTSSPVIDRALLRDLYNISDLVFLPSRHEGSSLTLLESAALRLPVVCSDIPLFREICDGNACMFSLDESPERVAAKIESVGSLGPVRMLRRIFSDYTWEKIYQEKILPLLKEILA